MVEFFVNGKKMGAKVHPMKRLIDVLREDLEMTGTKEGCGEGECGACSVLIDGKLVNSCLVPVSQVEGTRITTIEGIATGKKLHPIQEAFLKCGGAQCGICTPGMVVATAFLLSQNKKPSLEQIREGLAGNLCRCTGYRKIFVSVEKAALKKAARA